MHFFEYSNPPTHFVHFSIRLEKSCSLWSMIILFIFCRDEAIIRPMCIFGRVGLVLRVLVSLHWKFRTLLYKKVNHMHISISCDKWYIPHSCRIVDCRVGQLFRQIFGGLKLPRTFSFESPINHFETLQVTFDRFRPKKVLKIDFYEEA